MSYEVVIALYKDDTSWVQGGIPDPWLPTVYHKYGPPRPLFPIHYRSSVALPNVGREAHTYMYHIIENYDSLADYTCFVQGNPLDHSDFYDKLTNFQNVPFEDMGRHTTTEDEWGFPNHPNLPVGEMYELLFEEPLVGKHTFYPHSQFISSKERLLMRPKSFYEKTLSLLLSRPQGPWEMERLFGYMCGEPRFLKE
jgi:hypothetical protein